MSHSVPYLRVVASWVLALLLSSACSDSPEDTSAVGGDTPTGGGANLAPRPGDPTYVEGDAYVTQNGVYQCCRKGEGRECCGDVFGTCFRYGGVSGDCAGVGETIEAKDICSHCCQGLLPEHPLVKNPATGLCDIDAPPSLFVCVPCGDGVCGESENECTCPADCGTGQ